MEVYLDDQAFAVDGDPAGSLGRLVEEVRGCVAESDRVIVEIERYRTPVLVVAHRAVLRALYAYFVQLPLERVPYVEMPLHTVIELTPTAYGCQQERRELEVPEA